MARARTGVTCPPIRALRKASRPGHPAFSSEHVSSIGFEAFDCRAVMDYSNFQPVRARGMLLS